MKKQFTFFLLLLFTETTYSQNWQWTRTESGTGPDNGYSICTDGSGNCYMAGMFYTLGQAVIEKYNSVGNTVWTRNAWNGVARSITSDNEGYLYVAGDSSNQIIVAKYDTSGNMIWKIGGGTGNCNCISLDHSGSVFLTGGNAFSSSGNIFLQKYDTSGNQIWLRNINAIGNSICSDDSGISYVTGYFSDTVIFGIDTLIARGCRDIFIAKFDSSGNSIWAKRAGGNSPCYYSNDFGNGIAVDGIGNVYFTGSFVDTADFGSFTLISTTNQSNDIFLAKYDINGNALWVKKEGGWSDEEGRCIALDNSGNILIGGSYVPTTFFDGVPLTGWGNYDAFVAKYDSSGNFLNVIKAGGPTWNEYIYGICIDNSGNTFATGSFSNIAYFGTDTLYGAGGYDIFVSKINLSTGIVENEGYSFGVNIYPNPSNGSFTIDVDRTIHVREIFLTDILGNTILQQYPGNETKFNIIDLQSGIYILTVVDKDNRSTNKKIVSCTY